MDLLLAAFNNLPLSDQRTSAPVVKPHLCPVQQQSPLLSSASGKFVEVKRQRPKSNVLRHFDIPVRNKFNILDSSCLQDSVARGISMSQAAPSKELIVSKSRDCLVRQGGSAIDLAAGKYSESGGLDSKSAELGRVACDEFYIDIGQVCDLEQVDVGDKQISLVAPRDLSVGKPFGSNFDGSKPSAGSCRAWPKYSFSKAQKVMSALDFVPVQDFANHASESEAIPLVSLDSATVRRKQISSAGPRGKGGNFTVFSGFEKHSMADVSSFNSVSKYVISLRHEAVLILLHSFEHSFTAFSLYRNLRDPSPFRCLVYGCDIPLVSCSLLPPMVPCVDVGSSHANSLAKESFSDIAPSSSSCSSLCSLPSSTCSLSISIPLLSKAEIAIINDRLARLTKNSAPPSSSHSCRSTLCSSCSSDSDPDSSSIPIFPRRRSRRVSPVFRTIRTRSMAAAEQVVRSTRYSLYHR